MNNNEMKYFNEDELLLYDASNLPAVYLLKCMIIKVRRKLMGRIDNKARMVWNVDSVSDTSGPSDNVRNYLERKNIRTILSKLSLEKPIISACEIGCGYGRLTMVLSEYASNVVGYERESHLVEIASCLLPNIDFVKVNSLDTISTLGKGPFDLAMTCTVLQHLTDDFCKDVLEEIKPMINPGGYVLLIEKTVANQVTDNTENGLKFLSRARQIDTYSQWMKPFTFKFTTERVLEPTYSNKSPGTCMIYQKPL